MTTAPRMEEALETALKLVASDGMVLVTGSLFAVGAALAVWEKMGKARS